MSLPLQRESQAEERVVIRYRGFLLLQEQNQTWLVRPERSPMLLLPFRTHNCSLDEVKKILTQRLAQQNNLDEAA